MASILPTVSAAEAEYASYSNEAHEKSPQLQPPSSSPFTGAETNQRLRLLTELANIGEIGVASTSFPRGTLTLAQLYRPIRQRQSRKGKKEKPSTTQPHQKTPVEDAIAPAVPSSDDIFNLEGLYRPRLQMTNDVKPAFIRNDSNDCSTRSTSQSISSSEAAEQIWQEMKSGINITDEDDWSFTINSKSQKHCLGSSGENDAMIPAAVEFSELADEDVLDWSRKRRRLSNWEAFDSPYS